MGKPLMHTPGGVNNFRKNEGKREREEEEKKIKERNKARLNKERNSRWKIQEKNQSFHTYTHIFIKKLQGYVKKEEGWHDIWVES